MKIEINKQYMDAIMVGIFFPSMIKSNTFYSIIDSADGNISWAGACRCSRG